MASTRCMSEHIYKTTWSLYFLYLLIASWCSCAMYLILHALLGNLIHTALRKHLFSLLHLSLCTNNRDNPRVQLPREGNLSTTCVTNLTDVHTSPTDNCTTHVVRYCDLRLRHGVQELIIQAIGVHVWVHVHISVTIGWLSICSVSAHSPRVLFPRLVIAGRRCTLHILKHLKDQPQAFPHLLSIFASDGNNAFI